MKEFYRAIDPQYGRRLAEKLASFRTNELLGYRTAGSAAEHAAAGYLAGEMTRIGLEEVCAEPFPVDAWDFHHARLSFADAKGAERTAQLGGYQTQMVTAGPQPFEIVYAGRGTREEFDALEVSDKLVLIDINQRDDWWISFPTYEAHLHGAAAVLAAQSGGYGQASPDALNAQDICGPAAAPAFSISRADADRVKEALEMGGNRLAVSLDADSRVQRDGVSYNVIGRIPGREPHRMLLVTAHYDAYFDGFQDNAASVGLMLGLARALTRGGYKPRKTLIFCAVGAEEWGISDSRFDWSTGAYRLITRQHPEWVGRVEAAINLELPGYDMGYPTAQVRTSYELKAFVQRVGEDVPPVQGRFPKGVEAIAPTQTWADDFSLSICGIPCITTALREDFAQAKYHTQLDDKSTYDEGAFAFNHRLYGALLLALDGCALPPLCFRERMGALSASIDLDLLRAQGADADGLMSALLAAQDAASAADLRIERANREGVQSPLPRDVLAAFKAAEDALTSITWDYVSVFAHEVAAADLAMLLCAREALERGEADLALREYLWAVDNNWNAYHFSYPTYRHFTDSALDQPAERLSWGVGRVPIHLDLYDVIARLQHKARTGDADCRYEAAQLDAAIGRAQSILAGQVLDEARGLESLASLFRYIAGDG